MQDLHEIIDEVVEKRYYRFEQAVQLKDATRLWDLVAAAFEEANIRYHELSGKQDKKAQGRSRIAYQKSERNVMG